MAIQDFNQPYEIEWNKDSNGNPVSVLKQNEIHTITDNIVVLAQIPDEFYRVQITGKYEVKINTELTSADYFKVDYQSGFVYFHSSLEGLSITITQYYGRGIRRLIASRVQVEDEGNYYTSNNAEGCFGELAQRVQNLLDNVVEGTVAEVVDARINSVSATPVTYPNLKSRLDTDYQTIDDKIGILSNSTTDDKSSIINITNEINGKVNTYLGNSVIYITRDGAVGSGDETDLIQSVFDDAEGKEVWIPANKTFVASQIKYPKNCIIVGENEDTSILKQLDNTELSFIERLDAERSNISFQNLTIDGNKANQTTRNKAVNLEANTADFKNVKFINTIEESIYADCDVKLRVRLCDFSDMAEHTGVDGGISLAVKFVGDGEFIFNFNKVSAEAPSVAGRAPGGVEVSATSPKVTITNNEFDGLGTYSNNNFIGSVDLYTNADFAIVTENRFYNYRFTPLKLQNSGDVICQKNIVYSYDGASAGSAIVYQPGVRSHVPVAYDTNISNNIILASPSDGIDVQGDAVGGNTKNIILNSNIIMNCVGGIWMNYVDGATLNNNILDTLTGKGVEILNSTGRFEISKLKLNGCTTAIFARTGVTTAKFYVEGLECKNASSLGVSFRTCDTLQMVGSDINSTGSCIDASTIANGYFNMNIGNNAPAITTITNLFDAMNSWNPGMSWGAAKPSSGSYVQGHRVYNTGVTKDGSNMIVNYWLRLTTGSGHVLNTDWYAVYGSTVSPAT